MASQWIMVLMAIVIMAIASSKASGHTLQTSSENTVTNSLGKTLAIFEKGQLELKKSEIKVNQADSFSPPEPLLIISPTNSGSYPVLFFVHGCMMSNRDYTNLFELIASHGFIVVAPQLWSNPLSPPCQIEEIEMAATVINWLPSNLNGKLPTDVKADLSKFAVAGHSRGGKTAFALTLGLSITKLEVKISTLIGVDPVAGPSKEERTKPLILTYVDNSMDLKIPVTVIGTGLGNRTNLLMPPCAPNYCSHQQFFDELKQGTHFVIKDYGHTDVINGFFGPPLGDPTEIPAYAATLVCLNKPERVFSNIPMKRTVSGIIVSFLNTYFRNDPQNYRTILEQPSVAPAKLSSPKVKSGPDPILRTSVMDQM